MQTFKYQIYCPDFEYEIGLFDVMSIYLIENENVSEMVITFQITSYS